MTNSDKRSINRRGHANEHMKTSFAHSGRIAGIGILYDDYSEESYGGYYDFKCRMRTVSESLTPDEVQALNSPVITYRIKEVKP